MRDLVIYFAGGTMTGVFSAGVAKAFIEADLYPRIKAVYGASAGIMTGAYFLSRQADRGASIYWEDLVNNFIKSKTNFLMGTWQRFQNRFLKKIPFENLRDALNADYLFDIVGSKKELDIQTVLKQEIPLYLKLFNLDTHAIEYIEARRPDMMEVLKIGISVFPYMHEVKRIDGKRLIDAGIIEILGVNYLANKYPDSKIVFIVNRKGNTELNYKIKNILEGKFMEWMFNDPKLYKIHALAENKLQDDIEIIEKSSNMFLVSLHDNIPIVSRTTSPEILKQAYNSGVREGRNLLTKI